VLASWADTFYNVTIYILFFCKKSKKKNPADLKNKWDVDGQIVIEK